MDTHEGIFCLKSVPLKQQSFLVSASIYLPSSFDIFHFRKDLNRFCQVESPVRIHINLVTHQLRYCFPQEDLLRNKELP